MGASDVVQADREALREALLTAWRRGDVSGVRFRLQAAGIQTWINGRGMPCVSAVKATWLLGLTRNAVSAAIQRGRLPATRGVPDQACGGRAPWLIPLGHVLAYRVNEQMRSLGHVGGQQTAARVRILRGLLRNDDCPENGRNVMD